MIVVNLFVAAIIEGFEQESKLESANLSTYAITQITQNWVKFDPDETGIIECKHLIIFLSMIDLPFIDEN